VYHERIPCRQATDSGRVRRQGAPRSGLNITLLGLLMSSPGCGAAAPAPDVPVAPGKSAPLARVSVQSRLHQTVQLGDRVPGFDRLNLSAPSAALYDEKRDVYWVSNSNGEGSDDNGFISRLDPEGNVMTLNFIDGARADTTLHSPTGLALKDDRLLVSDVTALREFDADTGKALGKLEIPGARHLNDVAVGADGSVYIADLGADLDLAGGDASGRDAVYRVTPAGALLTLVKRAELRGPSALYADPSGLWLVSAGGDLWHLLAGDSSSVLPLSGSDTGSAAERYPLGLGKLRGLVRVPDGTFLVSGWEGRSVWRGFPGGTFETVVDGLEGPADLGYDTKRQRVLIPLFDGHALAVFDLPPFERAASRAPETSRGPTPEPASPVEKRRGPAS
jgi:hypothetical protein